MGRNKEEESSATDCVTDVTDVTDVSPMEVGKRKKEKGVERRKYVYLFNLISSILLKISMFVWGVAPRPPLEGLCCYD
ncbi:hypothetical protein [Microcoleus sp. Pol17_C1]|uniref:hypothetical protein n=1 Tax=unclassified Microcoleus TaxID=2642155 RepID=UPI002FD559A3